MSKQKFLDLYDRHMAAQAEADHQELVETSARTKKAFVSRFGFEPDRVEGRRVFFEDVEMVNARDGLWGVMGNCPKCGERLHSPLARDNVAIAQAIAEWRPDYVHFCNEPIETGVTWQDRLIQAVLDAIQENTYQE